MVLGLLFGSDKINKGNAINGDYKGMKKRQIVWGLVAMLIGMAILGCACGKKDAIGSADLKTETEESAIDADHIYKISDIDIDTGASEEISGFCQSDSGIHVLLTNSDYNEEDYKYSNRVIHISEENTNNEIKIPESEGMGYDGSSFVIL